MKLDLLHCVNTFRRGSLADTIGDIAVAMPEYNHILFASHDSLFHIDEEADLFAQSRGIDVRHYVDDDPKPIPGVILSYDHTVRPPDWPNSCIFVNYKHPINVTYTCTKIYEMLPSVDIMFKTATKQRMFREHCVGFFMGQSNYREFVATEFLRTAPKDWKLFLSTLTSHTPEVIEVFVQAFDSGRAIPCRMKAGGITKYLEQVDEVISIADPNGPYSRCELETMATRTPLIRTLTLQKAYDEIARLRNDKAAMAALVRRNARIAKTYDIRFGIVKIKEALKRVLT